ncbi:MAG: 3'(2'),5'-bisphosphate nucleotidase CysQ [Hyphomicrobiaceae bacterium]
MIDHARLVADLLPAVLEAGAVEMAYYQGGVTVETKADASPVTAADKEAEVILVAALERAAPGIPVVAEEAVAEGRIPDLGARFFLVDPLDGTREFINKRDEFTVNVALVDKGEPCFGIVYVPALGDLYVTLGDRKAAMARIAPQRPAPVAPRVAFQSIEVRRPDMTALTAVASRSHASPETATYLDQYAIAARRDAGSSLKFCLIARGEADIYPRLGPTMAWDTAAGHAVLRAAGGCVTDIANRPLTYGRSAGETPLDRLRNPHFVAWGAAAPFPKS